MRRKKRRKRRRSEPAGETHVQMSHLHQPRHTDPEPADVEVGKSWAPEQPRWPAGSRLGGQWRPTGAREDGPVVERPSLFDLLDTDSTPPEEPPPTRPAILEKRAPTAVEPARPAVLDRIGESDSRSKPALLASTTMQPAAVDTGTPIPVDRLEKAATLLSGLAELVAAGEPVTAAQARQIVDTAAAETAAWHHTYPTELAKRAPATPARPAVLGPAPELEVSKFDPRQPRAPKGSGAGGQWVAGGSVSGGKGPMRGPGGGGGGSSTLTPGPLVRRQIDRLDGWQPGDTHVINRHGAVSPDGKELDAIVRNSDDDYNQAEDFKATARKIQAAKPVTSPMSRNEGEQIVASMFDLEDDRWQKAFTDRPPFTGLPKLGDRVSGRARIDGDNKVWEGRVVGYDRHSAPGDAHVFIETDFRDAAGWRRTVTVPTERQGADDDD